MGGIYRVGFMGDSYLSLFLSSAYAQASGYAMMLLVFLFFARMLPIIALSPFFGARVLPNPTKVFLAFSLFIIFLPTLLLSVGGPLEFNTKFMLLLLKEVFVGLSIGFIMSIPFTIVQSAGIIIDHQRGGASLMVNDPTIQNQSSPLGTLFNMVLIYIFYMIDGPFLFIDAIIKSYEIIPSDQFLNPAFFNVGSSFSKIMIQLFNQMMVITMQISAPALIAILMTDVFLGIANRLAPQVQITFLGMPLKSLLGLTVICFGWQLMTSEFIKQSYFWINNVLNLLKAFIIPAGQPFIR